MYIGYNLVHVVCFVRVSISHFILILIHVHVLNVILNSSFHIYQNWRYGRGAVQNVIPASTSVSRSVGKIIPSLKGLDFAHVSGSQVIGCFL